MCPFDHRVLRGGSFNNNRRNVRCAYRNRNNPDNRNINNGFRVVVSTFFWRFEIKPGLPRGLLITFAAEAKNGGVHSWPRRNFGRANSNCPTPWEFSPALGSFLGTLLWMNSSIPGKICC
jgi:hypothetical protein